MSEKVSCPACSEYSSRVLQRFSDGKSCLNCGLSSEAAHEIWSIQRTRADMALKTQLATTIIERDKLETEVLRLRARLATVRYALEEDEKVTR